MTKYSLESKYSKGPISVTEARSLEQAINFFAKRKDLPLEKFNKLYEVNKKED